MKGGFGKFLTFILGLVVGVLLVGGTIAGVVYYAVAAVSVNDVENTQSRNSLSSTRTLKSATNPYLTFTIW